LITIQRVRAEIAAFKSSGDDHLVVRRERRQQRIEQRLRRAIGDDDLVQPVVETMVAQQRCLHRALQFRRAVDIGVTGLAAQCRLMRRRDHMVRCREIQIA
jgi:hypothetical protein